MTFVERQGGRACWSARNIKLIAAWGGEDKKALQLGKKGRDLAIAQKWGREKKNENKGATLNRGLNRTISSLLKKKGGRRRYKERGGGIKKRRKKHCRAPSKVPKTKQITPLKKENL